MKYYIENVKSAITVAYIHSIPLAGITKIPDFASQIAGGRFIGKIND
jgi:hypothetical protein